VQRRACEGVQKEEEKHIHHYSSLISSDYEYIEGFGDLDECNGREGVTPEFPEGTYYYVITNEFPGVPRCFVGTPSDDFKLGPG